MKKGKIRYLNLYDVNHLRYLLDLSERDFNTILHSPEDYFSVFEKEIKGKKRPLVNIKPPLKKALQSLNLRLQQIEMPFYMQGGVRERSFITNAVVHANANTVLKADIKDFFPSIGFERVEHMCKTRLRCSAMVAKSIATICTYNNALPQGAPTSTMIANLVIERLAYRLNRLAEEHNAKYTQYVDDITISGPRHIDKLIPTIVKIIEDEGFICHPEKLIVLHRGDEHEITGVRVDHGKDVPSKMLKAVREQVETQAQSANNKEERSLEGKICHVKQLNPGAGKSLRRQRLKTKKQSQV